MRALVVALACWVLTGPVSAQQAMPSTPVLIVDSDLLYQNSRYGQQIRDGLDADAADLKAENDRIVAALTEEERSLTLRRPTMEPEAFRKEAQDFDTKVQGIRRARDAKEVSLQAARVTARDDFFTAVRDVVGQLMLERGAALILDRRSVFLALSAVDVTEDAIARIDATFMDTATAPAPAADGPALIEESDTPASVDAPAAPAIPDPMTLDR